MNSKIVCENKIETVNFKLMSNDDERKYQELYMEHRERNEVIPISPCDYFNTVNAVMFSETLEEVKERFSRTWSEYAVNSFINNINK